MEPNSPHYEDLDLEILGDGMPPPARGRTAALIAAAVAITALAVLSGKFSGSPSAPAGQAESPAAQASATAYDQQNSLPTLWQGVYDSQVPAAVRHC